MRRTEHFTCKKSGKRAYRDEDSAESALRSCGKRREQLRKQVPRILRQERRIYRCEWCDGYHLTSLEAWV